MKAVRIQVVAAIALALVPAGSVVAAAAAAGGSHAAASGTPVLAVGALSMDQAVKLVERRYKARVVRAETRKQATRTIYVLRVLDDSGRVFTVRVDAASGAIL